MRIKNWHTYQHYKHRSPPWIKFHRSLLNDPEWFALDGDASKVLAMCWLVAADSEGELPNIRKLAFRLRMTEKELIKQISKLNHWLEYDDSGMLADCKQVATPETETETETYITALRAEDGWPKDYEEKFWQAYPRKVGKGGALAKLGRIRKEGGVSFAQILSAIGTIKATEEKYIPHPLTWLNQGRYLDGQGAAPKAEIGEVVGGYVWDGSKWKAPDPIHLEAAE